MQLRNSATLEIVEAIAERTVEAFGRGSEKQKEDFLHLWGRLAVGEAEQRRETVSVPVVVPGLAEQVALPWLSSSGLTRRVWTIRSGV